MSLVNEALKKVSAESTSPHAAAPRIPCTLTPPRKNPFGGWFLALGVLALAAALLAAGSLFLGRARAAPAIVPPTPPVALVPESIPAAAGAREGEALPEPLAIQRRAVTASPVSEQTKNNSVEVPASDPVATPTPSVTTPAPPTTVAPTISSVPAVPPVLAVPPVPTVPTVPTTQPMAAPTPALPPPPPAPPAPVPPATQPAPPLVPAYLDPQTLDVPGYGKLKLTGIANSPLGTRAVINNAILSAGDQVGPVTLIDIHGKRVQLRIDEKAYTLTLP